MEGFKHMRDIEFKLVATKATHFIFSWELFISKYQAEGVRVIFGRLLLSYFPSVKHKTQIDSVHHYYHHHIDFQSS